MTQQLLIKKLLLGILLGPIALGLTGCYSKCSPFKRPKDNNNPAQINTPVSRITTAANDCRYPNTDTAAKDTFQIKLSGRITAGVIFPIN